MAKIISSTNDRKKIIILSRVSTGQQSLEAQTNELKAEARRLGYSDENQIILENVESAIKLKEEERLGIQRLKQHIENDKDVDCVICWEPSRLSRRQADLYSMRDYLFERKIQLYILNPYVKLLTDDRTKIDTTASIVFSLFATISENEMNIKKERFIRAKNELRQNGKKFGGATIFGYIKNKDKYMEPHPLHSKIISAIFNYYANEPDASFYSTYVWASSKWPDVFPALPYIKAQHKIRHIFEVKVYCEGNWCYPPIVSKELYDKVWEKSKTARCQPRYECKHNWLGRGRLYCAHCGKMLTPVAGRVLAYNCSTDKEHNVTVNIDAVEWLLWEEAKIAANIKAMTSNTDIIIETNRQIDEKKNLINSYKTNIDKLEDKQKKLLSVYLEGNITKELFDAQNSSIVAEIKAYTTKRDSLNAEITELQNILNTPQDAMKLQHVNYDQVDNFETKLEIVRDVISKVWVEKIEPKTYTLDFEYRGVIVPQVGHYIYTAKNQYKRIYRVNADETKDLIYENVKPTRKNAITGKFEK